jgi:hypothetical protein
MTVTDGQTTAGYVSAREGSHFAFAADGTLIGKFRTRQEAVNALPYAHALCVDSGKGRQS